MGLSNRILSKRADKVCISYPPKSYPDIEKEKLVYTGNPVRSDIYDGNKERALKEFNLNEELPVIMVIGGSQGALAINQVISEALPKLLLKYQILHVSGERDYDWLGFQAGKLTPELAANYHLYNFLSGNLKDAYKAADLVISRAGNNVIAELAALSRPTILIPLENSANGHQASNARILSRMGAAMLILEESLSARVLERKVDYLFENPEELAGLATKLSKLSSPEAAGAVADIVYELGQSFLEETKTEEGSAKEPTE